MLTQTYRRPAQRRALTLVELVIAMAVLTMIVGTLGGLAKTSQQAFEYSEGYGVATQHARVAVDRIGQNVAKATANLKFPGAIVVAESVNGFRYPDTLVVWCPSGAAADPAGLPRYNELTVYCPSPTAPNQLVELTAPTDTRIVPAITDIAGWQAAMTALKRNATTKTTVLSTLLRTCSTTPTGAQNLRGAVRFETRLRPSDSDWTDYDVGATTWMNLPWVQGIYGSQAGLRQTWVRMELQFMPGVAWTASNPAAAQGVAYFGSAALYYKLSHP